MILLRNVAVAVVATCAFVSCSAATYEKTAERALPARAGLQLAVVQVHENIPLHYVGLKHVVVCRSAATADAPGNSRDGIAPGWRLVGYLANLDRGDTSRKGRQAALDRAEHLARESLALGDGWIAWKASFLVNVSFDECRSWEAFRPAQHLPPEDIDVSGLRNPCEPEHCRRLAFELLHPMRVSDLEVDAAARRAAFTIRSDAIKGSHARRIETLDGGRTWTAKDANRL